MGPPPATIPRLQRFAYEIFCYNIQKKSSNEKIALVVYTKKDRITCSGSPILSILKHLLRRLVLLQNLHRFAEAHRVNNLALTQELERVLQIDVVGHVDQPLVRGARLLLGGDVLVQIGDRIAFRGDIRRRPRHAGGILVE